MQINFHESIRIKKICCWTLVIEPMRHDRTCKWAQGTTGPQTSPNINENITTRPGAVWKKTENTRSILEFSEILKLIKEPYLQQLWRFDWWAIPEPIKSSPEPIVSPEWSSRSGWQNHQVAHVDPTLILNKILKNDQILEGLVILNCLGWKTMSKTPIVSTISNYG